PTFENVRLVLVGKPNIPSSALKDVTVLDRPNDRALAALYKNAAAFLYPSWYEGFGLPLHEAAQFHTPCLASTASALPETAPKGTQFAPPAKPHLWAAAIKEILKEPTRFRTETELGGWEEAGGMVGTWYRTWYQNRDAQT
ncbi:MAG: glycosyltransferase, partial [Patescibacteria group bacterium]